MPGLPQAPAFADAPPILQTNFSQSDIATDPLQYLPPMAAERLRSLMQRAADLHILRPAIEDRQAANAARAESERALQRLTERPMQGGFGLADDDPNVVREQTKLAALKREAQRLSDLDAVRSGAWQAAARVESAARAWLADGRPRGTALEDFDGPEPMVQKGESLLDCIERHRRRARELQADLNRISASPYPSAYAKQQMREQIAVLAERGAVNVAGLIEHDGEIVFPVIQIKARVFNSEPAAVAYHEAPDALALFAWMHKPALIAALDREIDAEADDRAALTPEAREKAEAQVMADLLAVERDECSLVWKAMEQNLPVEFRADTNPLAVLSVQLVTAATAERPPDTSWPHAVSLVGR